MHQCAVSLLARGEAPASDGFERAMDGYAAAIGLVRKEGLTRGLPSDMVERVFALGFALEQLRLNLRGSDGPSPKLSALRILCRLSPEAKRDESVA
jgi:hypothetical protein